MIEPSPIPAGPEPLTVQAIARVRAAAAKFGKFALAKKAGIWESNLRKVDQDDWTPNSETLRKCEEAIPALEALHGPLGDAPTSEIAEAKAP
jgi:hypothetical protein